MASARRCQKLPPCPRKPITAKSKMDTLLAKAGWTQDGGNTSMITCLRRRKKSSCTGETADIEQMSESM